MFKCYDKQCTNEVTERLTLCDSCKEIYYPTAKPTDLRERMRLLASRAPEKVVVPSLPKIPKSSGKQCCACPKKKKNTVTVEIDRTGVFICWSHKTVYERTYGINWKITALHMCRSNEAEKGGEQSESFGKY
jgi:hypothetical protein